MLIVTGMVALVLAISAIIAIRLRAAERAVARCREWLPVSGHVVASSIRAVFSEDVGTQYTPNVEYRYVFGDRRYASEVLSVGMNVRYTRRGAERRIAPYRSGQPVQVFVDPLDPSNSVLERRAPIIPLLWTLLVAAWIVLFVGLGLLLIPGVDGPEPMLRIGFGQQSREVDADAHHGMSTRRAA